MWIVSPSLPAMLRIASSCAEPAVRLPPVHPRKSAGRGKNPFLFAMLFEKNIEIFSDPNPSVLCVFSICLPPFRGWMPGGGREAGSWQGDAMRELWAAWDSPAYTSVVGGAAYNTNHSSGCYQTVDGAGYHTYGLRASLTTPTAPENRPVNVALPVCIYLGLPA